MRFSFAFIFSLLFLFATEQAFSQVSGNVGASMKIATRKSGCTSGIGFRCGGKLTAGIKYTIKLEAPNQVIGDFSKEGNGVLLFTVNKETGVLPEGAESYFSGETFSLEESWDVPADFLDALEHEGSMTIEAGEYAITSTAESYIIRFTY